MLVNVKNTGLRHEKRKILLKVYSTVLNVELKRNKHNQFGLMKTILTFSILWLKKKR